MIYSYNESIKLDTKNKYALHNKGLLLWDLGRYEEALEMLIKINKFVFSFNKYLEQNSSNFTI